MRELIVFNFTMDSKHPLLSHQPDIAHLLAEFFDVVTVITNDGTSYKDGNLQVLSVGWKEGRKLRNLIRFYRNALPLIVRKRNNSVIFSHMTDLQSCLVGPFTTLLRVPHYLWYAHTHKSSYLKIANLFVDGIITSTKGSCPIESEKVFPIGQAIDEHFFKPSQAKDNSAVSRGVHVGRLDPSKNLDLIISAVATLRGQLPDLSFTQIGSPSTATAKLAFDSLQTKWHTAISEGWVTVRDSVTRQEIPSLLSNFDFFIHAYEGSLDKSLIEATMCKLPVITTNPEYLTEFGSWSSGVKISLVSEYLSLLTMDSASFTEEIDRRYKIALDRHSRARWVQSLVNLLKNKTLTNGGSSN
jgi:glycosyltransferase involved in cell wall biosynthesis